MTRTDLNTLVLAATGKTGRRVADRLEALGVPTRRASRSAAIPFDWDRPETWAPALEGQDAVYVVYTPDLSVPAAPAAIAEFTRLAAEAGVQRLVLLSGRGEPEAKECEDLAIASGIDTTVVRAAWFAQNFSEGDFSDMVRGGVLALPVGDVPEPFIDIDDIADVVVAALTEDGHAGQVYEVSGPRALTFAEVAAELSAAAGREIQLAPLPYDEFAAGAAEAGVPAELIELFGYLFNTVLDGRNAEPADGVQRALGREPRAFADFARAAAAAGSFDAQTQGV